MANKKGKTAESKSWTVLVVGDLGKIASFRLPKALLLSMIGTLVGFCAIVVVSSVLYHGMRTENVALKDDLERVRTELLAANEAKEGAEVRLMLFADKGQKSGRREKKGPPKVTSEGLKTPKKPAVVEQKPQSQTTSHTNAKQEPKPEAIQIARRAIDTEPDKNPVFTTSEAATEEAGQPGEVSESTDETEESRLDETMDEVEPPTAGPSKQELLSAALTSPGSITPDNLIVENLELRSKTDDRSVKFQFSLKNVDATGKKISGYTFVVLKPREGTQEPPRGAPWTPIKEGKPTIFKRGQYFSISRFKYVRGNIPEIQDLKRFESATVYVYTEAGELLLEKRFPIDTVLKT